MHVPFLLPSNCTVIQREQCSVNLIFDYVAQTISFNFDFEPFKQRDTAVYATDNIIKTIINLEKDPFIQHTVSYYCSTEDKCDLKYVETEAVPLYSIKSCDHLRALLVLYLNPDMAPPRRECVQNDNTTLECDSPCDLIYENSNQITRSCDGQVDLSFETTVGRSTPIIKPEYNNRRFAYACTTPECNGIQMQIRIQRLVDSDEKCIITLNDTIESTTSTSTTIPTPATFTTTTIIPTITSNSPIINETTSVHDHHNHATTFSKSFVSIIYTLVFVYFFL